MHLEKDFVNPSFPVFRYFFALTVNYPNQCSILTAYCSSLCYVLDLLQKHRNSVSFFAITKFNSLLTLESVLKNRCEIKLVADYAFFKRIGNGNYANCARYLVNMVERVNAMFTSVDWGLSANGKHFMNMGFAVKEMKILDKASDKPGHYNAESSSSGQFSSKDLIKVVIAWFAQSITDFSLFRSRKEPILLV